MTARTYLVNGLVAGLVAGLLAFAVAFLVGEPPIDDAIAVEEAAAAAAPAEPTEPEEGHNSEVTRGEQAGPGLATAVVLFGVVLGGVVAIGAAFAAGRLGGLRPAGAVALVSVVGFAAWVLVPWLKYPPNPPATGSGETIGERTALYFSFVSLSVLAALGFVVLAARLLPRLGAWAAVCLPLLGYVVVMLVAALVLAPIDEVPDTFPANVLFEFRMSSLLTQATMWAGIGIVLSGLVDRSHRRAVAEAERRAAAAAL